MYWFWWQWLDVDGETRVEVSLQCNGTLTVLHPKKHKVAPQPR